MCPAATVRHLKHPPLPQEASCSRPLIPQLIQAMSTCYIHPCKGVLHHLIDIISRIVQLLVLTFHFASFFANKQTQKGLPPQKKSRIDRHLGKTEFSQRLEAFALDFASQFATSAWNSLTLKNLIPSPGP